MCSNKKRDANFLTTGTANSSKRFILLAWKYGKAPWSVHAVFGWVSSDHAWKWRNAVKAAKVAKNDVRTAVRDDYVKSAEQIIKNSDGALKSSESAIRFKEVKKLKPKNPRKIAFVADEKRSQGQHRV